MTTRTAVLGAAIPPANVQTTLFTVPAGFTNILKSVWMHNDAGGNNFLSLILARTGQPNFIIIFGQLFAPGDIGSWNGFLAMAPGDSLQALAPAGSAEFWASGSRLFGVAP